MQGNRAKIHQQDLKTLFNDISAGQLRQGWVRFVENYRRRRFGADWENRQIGPREFFFLVPGISFGLLILGAVFLFVFLIDSLGHSFSEHGSFREIYALTSISKRLKRR
ncbi:uncharacterized protein LOC132548154 [Ylistrum balloti]|uniref:uncharacterized protein LOC132548154 n=1 Tax=Ylistrum balloti TaxID=509963 RepID=UPI002905D1C0|nr:uncharacterized protein LOC132548154 [Ylistrum balloti]